LKRSWAFGRRRSGRSSFACAALARRTRRPFDQRQQGKDKKRQKFFE
jgi:hypothetical protein